MSIVSCSTTSTTAYKVTADTTGKLDFQTGSGPTTYMTLTAAGDLGVGTTSPTQHFEISGTSTQYISAISTNGANAGIRMNSSGNRDFGIFSDGAMRFYDFTATAERARITSAGDFLVGTTSSLTSGRSAFWSSTAVPAAEFRVNAASSDATQAISIVKNSTTNTTAQVIANFTINSGGTGAGQINCNGASQAAFGSFSDSRLKENIVDLPSQLSNIMALRPVEFDYIESEGGGHQIGFIAQEMQTVYPDAIGERQPDNMLSITGWSKTEARLVKAIQEQQALITQLQADVAALKGAA